MAATSLRSYEVNHRVHPIHRGEEGVGIVDAAHHGMHLHSARQAAQVAPRGEQDTDLEIGVTSKAAH